MRAITKVLIAGVVEEAYAAEVGTKVAVSETYFFTDGFQLHVAVIVDAVTVETLIHPTIFFPSCLKVTFPVAPVTVTTMLVGCL